MLLFCFSFFFSFSSEQIFANVCVHVVGVKVVHVI